MALLAQFQELHSGAQQLRAGHPLRRDLRALFRNCGGFVGGFCVRHVNQSFFSADFAQNDLSPRCLETSSRIFAIIDARSAARRDGGFFIAPTNKCAEELNFLIDSYQQVREHISAPSSCA